MTIPVNPMPTDGRLYSNITPFTIRDNMSMIYIIEQMRIYVNDKLVPFINENIANLDQSWLDKVAELIASWEAQSAELIEQVNTAVESIGTSVEDAEAAKVAAEAARDLAEQFASTMTEIQDQAVASILSRPNSFTRTALNGLYAQLGPYMDMVDIILNGRLSAANIALKADKIFVEENFASKATQTVVETGRLSPTLLNLNIDSRIGAFDMDDKIAGEILDKESNTHIALEKFSLANEKPHTFAGFRESMKNQATKQAKILCIGDSVTEGTGVANISDTWPYKVAAKLRDAFPTVPSNSKDARGWNPIAKSAGTLFPLWSVSGTNDTSSAFGFRNIKSQSISAGATITGTVIGTSIDIWHTRGPSTVAFQVRVDGVLIGSYGGPFGSVQSGYWNNIPLGASGSHTVVITAGVGAAFINGVTVYDGNELSGISVTNAGVNGAQSVTWKAAVDSGTWKQDINALSAETIIVMLGLNDYSSSTGAYNYIANLRALVESLRANNNKGLPTILLVSPYKEDWSAIPSFETYEFAMSQLADEMGCGYFDLRTVMPDVGTPEGTASGYYADAVHPNVAGNEKIATEITNFLLARM